MTRDANKQSVERCDEYRHQWTRPVNPELDRYSERLNPKRIICAKCGTNPKAKQIERIDAILDLRSLLKPGDTVYTTLRHVSRSGMSRVIDAHLIRDNEPRWIGSMVAKALEYRFNDRQQGLTVGGCGMDMGFHVVSTLSRILFPGGFGCIGEGNGYGTSCPSNDHSNGDRDYTEHGRHYPHALGCECGLVDTEHWHNSGDYALRHKWL